MAHKTSQPVSAVIAKQKPAAKSTDRTVAAPTRAVDSAAYASLNLDNLQPADILTLQRTIGNSATTRLIQTKLTVGPAGDQYEQEADQVAAQVMTMPAPAEIQSPVQRAAEEEEELQMKPLAASITPLVQRAPDEEEELQLKPLTERVQRVEEEEELQMKPEVQRASSGAGFEVGGEFEQQLAASRGGGNPLPAEVRSFMEPRFGADFSGVRIHTGGESAQLNRSVSAQAFTHGSDIYLGEGKDDLASAQGKQLLAHELTHVMQQGAAQSVQRATMRLIQRAWDLAAYEKTNANGYAALLTKMEGLTSAMGRSRLAKLAALTDSPEQLTVLLNMGTLKLETYLKSYDAATLQMLMTLIGRTEFFKVMDELVKFTIDVKDFLAKNPAATLVDLKAQIASAKNTAGLISSKGEIAYTTIAAVVGDGKKDEKTAVATAVQGLDAGTLLGVPYRNNEGDLPGVRRAGGYTEYDVTPPAGTGDRGRRRLVVHNAKQFVYYTWNHFGNDGTTLPAFVRIR